MKETQLQYLGRQLKRELKNLRAINVSSSTWRDLGAAIIDCMDALMNYEEEKLNDN